MRSMVTQCSKIFTYNVQIQLQEASAATSAMAGRRIRLMLDMTRQLGHVRARRAKTL